MKTVDQKRVKKILRDLIEDKEITGFEMVELPDGSEKSFTFFYTDKESDEMTMKDYENWVASEKLKNGKV